jgi:phospholipid N-methyltransferase
MMAVEGAKAVIESMGNLFLQFWDKVKFRHHDTFERDIEALSKGLEFVAKVHEAVENQAITEEEAKNLKTRVFREVDQLIGLGVTLPLRNSTVDQRQLLIEKRDTKLLGTGMQSENEDDNVGDAE